jgi:beta-1,4-N-acetylglucosaminyltransferase
MKIMFVSSTGGHLAQILALNDVWKDHERHWVTFRKPDAEAALAGEEITWAHHPTTRNIPNALRNLRLAVSLVRRVRPDVMVSTGAGVAFPFFIMAKVLGIRTVYLEVFDRIDSSTMTGRLCYPLSDVFALQWPEQKSMYAKGTVIGRTM